MFHISIYQIKINTITNIGSLNIGSAILTGNQASSVDGGDGGAGSDGNGHAAEEVHPSHPTHPGHPEADPGAPSV